MKAELITITGASTSLEKAVQVATENFNEAIDQYQKLTIEQLSCYTIIEAVPRAQDTAPSYVYVITAWICYEE